ncbi:hypothetical protein [Catenulispora subtropica]|uniref:hypothetical protein n=1 Tax=Catenulispora subtropica TaxID=450798 RepID=UPI0031D1AD17
MTETDRPASGGDGQDDGDLASRPRSVVHGPLPWIAGGVLILAQLMIVVLVGGRARTLGAVLLAVATLAAVAAVTRPPGGRWRARRGRSRPDRRRR